MRAVLGPSWGLELRVLFGRPTPQIDDLRAQLDDRFRRPLMSYFLRHERTREEAEDLTQEVFVRIVLRANRERIDDPDALVFVTAANILKTHIRDGKRRSSVSIDGLDAAPVPDVFIEDRTPERVLLAKERAEAMLAALNALGPRTRDIYILFRVEGINQQDIAAQFGITRSMVEKEVKKAAVHLARRFGRKGP